MFLFIKKAEKIKTIDSVDGGGLRLQFPFALVYCFRRRIQGFCAAHFYKAAIIISNLFLKIKGG